jgi:Family of unknown function (DUF5329)
MSASSSVLALGCACLCVCALVHAEARAQPGAQPRTKEPVVQTAKPAAAAPREIAALIDALGDSRCEFQRNGRWYAAAAARAHLQRKYDYLRKRDLAPSAELFIERAASRSSMTDTAYRVRCPGKAEEASADWFLGRLRQLRKQTD